MTHVEIKELDQLLELPVGSVVLDAFSACCTKIAERDDSHAGLFAWVRATSAVRNGRHYHWPYLPAEVLYRPDSEVVG